MGFLIMGNYNFHTDYVANKKAIAEICKSFSIDLLSDYREVTIGDQKRVVDTVIKPLFAKASRGYLYNNGDDYKIGEKLQEVIMPQKNKFEFQLSKNLFDGLEDFWLDNYQRGTIICVGDANYYDLASIFKNTYDPFTIDNLRARLSKPAFNYSIRATKKKNRIAFSIAAFDGLKWLNIISENSIGEIFDIAMRNCQFTQAFINRYKLHLPLYERGLVKIRKKNTSRNESQLRLTGEMPRPDILKKHPNWTHCLAEEGEDGQDETTIKPDREKDIIGAETIYTVADAIYPDGEARPALLFAMMDLHRGNVESLYVLEQDFEWQIEIFGDEWGPFEYAENTIEPYDKKRLPLKIKSRLPMPNGKKFIEFTVESDGMITK